MEGWVSVHRQIVNHWTYQEKRIFSKFEAWVDLILMANHQDARFPLGNEIVEAKRGEVITSEVKLMERWRWGKSKTRSFLDLLEKDGMIIKKSDRKKTTISIVKYGDFQPQHTTDRPQADRKQTATRPQSDTINNVNNDNNENNDNKKEKYPDDSPYFRMAVYFYGKICEWTDKVSMPDFQKWADECRKIIDLDKRDKADVKNVIDWVTKDSFWQANVLSPSKLRSQFEKLQVQMDRPQRQFAVHKGGQSGKQSIPVVQPLIDSSNRLSDEELAAARAMAQKLDERFGKKEA